MNNKKHILSKIIPILGIVIVIGVLLGITGLLPPQSEVEKIEVPDTQPIYKTLQLIKNHDTLEQTIESTSKPQTMAVPRPACYPHCLDGATYEDMPIPCQLCYDYYMDQQRIHGPKI